MKPAIKGTIHMTDYEATAKKFKALSEQMRLKIIEMLTYREMCACEILESLSISQPTLSHHMKVLMDCNLVSGQKDATWMYYSINRASIENLHHLIDEVIQQKEDCVYHSIKKECKK
jgi:ArsR family transcriptional regulator